MYRFDILLTYSKDDASSDGLVEQSQRAHRIMSTLFLMQSAQTRWPHVNIVWSKTKCSGLHVILPKPPYQILPNITQSYVILRDLT